MDQRDWYVGQLVTEGEMDGAFAAVEASIHQAHADLGLVGIISGFTVSPDSPADLTVNVVGGKAVSSLGERIYSPDASTTNVDCEFDINGDPTAVTTIGNQRVLSVIAFFDRALSDPRTDALSATVYFRRDEFLSFAIVQGAETNGTAAAPAVPSGGVRLANIRITYGMTAITSGQIEDDTRQWMFRLGPGGPVTINVGTINDAFAGIMTALNNHISGFSLVHTADDVAYETSGNWVDGTKLASTNVEAALDEVVSDLASIVTTASGADRVGIGEDANSPTTLAAGPIAFRLAEMRKAENMSYAGSGNWADATAIPAGSIEATIDLIVSSLGATSGSGGAIKVGIGARTAWLGGRTNPATHVYAAVDKIITDLNAVSAGDDGAERIGAEASSGYTLGSVRSQLNEVGPSATTVYTGPKSFSDITASGSTHYKVASRSVTRAQGSILYNGNSGAAGPDLISVGATQTATQNWDRAPQGSTVNSVVFWSKRASTGSAPTTKATASLIKMDLTTGLTAVIGSATVDPSSLATYETHHSFSISGLSEVIDRTKYNYYSQLVGESGSNTLAVLWYGCQVVHTVTTCEESQ